MKPILSNRLFNTGFQSEDLIFGTAIKGLCALAASALAIVGLSGSQPFEMAAIAAIVVGAAFIFEQGAIVTQANRLTIPANVRSDARDSHEARDRIGLLLTFAAGVIGVVAGMIALIGTFDIRAVAIAAIVFGMALTFHVRAAKVLMPIPEALTTPWVEAVKATRAVGGLATVILGILALVGTNRLDLALTGVLIAALALVVDSAARIVMIARAARDQGP